MERKKNQVKKKREYPYLLLQLLDMANKPPFLRRQKALRLQQPCLVGEIQIAIIKYHIRNIEQNQ